LRKALGRDGDLIRTEVGRGYRFIGRVRRTSASVETSPADEREPESDTDLAKISVRLRQIEIQLAEMRSVLATPMQKLGTFTTFFRH
jgi:DNA-binding winged helix-turn-helix (wHTH) protein